MTAPRDPKFVVAQRPVNRRTALKQAAQSPLKVPLAMQLRLRASQARNRLGAPLAQQLAAPDPRTRAALPKQAIVGSVMAVGGAGGLLLAWLQSSMLAGMAGVAALAAGLLLASRRPPAAMTAQMPVAPLFDPASIAAFDIALDAVAHEVPAAIVQPLADVKQLVLRIARHPAAVSIDEHFRLEDRLYVNECVRRYLPDSLQGYLAVPQAQRAQVPPGGESAQALLLSQLEMLREELAMREGKLARSATEALLRQERFLKSKASR